MSLRARILGAMMTTALLPLIASAWLYVAHRQASLEQIQMGLVLLALLAMGGAVMVAELTLRRQAARLVGAITRVDAGNYLEPIGAPYPRGELGEVMAAIDRMTASLEQQRLTIEAHNDELRRQAHEDALTGVGNRKLLLDRLHLAMVYTRRSGRCTGVLVLDLDRFKTVNDSLGHSEGDALLREVARRLQRCVREGDTVARSGGDEFVLVLADLADPADVVPVAQKVLRALSEPVALGGQPWTLGASVGISVFPRDGGSADDLVRHADTAMYRAKALGGGAMAFFTPEMDRETAERLQIEAGLRRAIEHGELRLHYQPIVNVRSGRISAAEALVRWQAPGHGLVAPGRFIPIAEETGLIVPIGEWVLREACRQIRAWRDAGCGDLPVAVNLSARQFGAASLEDSVRDALRVSGCPPHLLHLEITESMVMDRGEQALDTLHRLKALGVELSIDDFGTGYSSLAYLKHFPVDKLKIDRSFVRDLNAQTGEDAIVDAILMLAAKLGMRAVAEGVETREQLAYLHRQSCHEYQGFLFAQPAPAEVLEGLLRGQRRGLDRPSPGAWPLASAV